MADAALQGGGTVHIAPNSRSVDEPAGNHAQANPAKADPARADHAKAEQSPGETCKSDFSASQAAHTGHDTDLDTPAMIDVPASPGSQASPISGSGSETDGDAMADQVAGERDTQPDTSGLTPDAFEGLSLADLILKSLDDDKAQDVMAVDLEGKSSMADTMVIASGRSHRHVAAMADHLCERIKAAGFSSPKVEGLPHCDWVLIDAGDVIIHLFRPEVRAFYNLEKIWGVEPPKGDA